MINPIKLEIDKIYNKIDKIAKKGNDGYLEYYSYIDTLINSHKYSFLLETLEIKYNIQILNLTIIDVKKNSWKEILFKTNTIIQDYKYNLLKNKGIYQSALLYYKEVDKTKIYVTDSTGTGSVLVPIIQNGDLIAIDILKKGYGYSNQTSINIVGGIGTSSATPLIRGGKIFLASLTATGSNHNIDIKLGKIEENNIIISEYEQILGNKTVELVATKYGHIDSYTFSNWNNNYNHDKNLIKLYEDGINYLLS